MLPCLIGHHLRLHRLAWAINTSVGEKRDLCASLTHIVVIIVGMTILFGVCFVLRRVDVHKVRTVVFLIGVHHLALIIQIQSDFPLSSRALTPDSRVHLQFQLRRRNGLPLLSIHYRIANLILWQSLRHHEKIAHMQQAATHRQRTAISCLRVPGPLKLYQIDAQGQSLNHHRIF